MKISVAMTTYNGAKYIISQLDSLMNQKRSIDQLVICDDCSNDETVDLIRNYFQSKSFDGLTLRINDKNQGYIKNFYQAISLCEGELIFLCDQDDIWHQDKIELMEEQFLKKQKIVALNTSFIKIDSDGEPFIDQQMDSKNNYGLLSFPLEQGQLANIPFEQVIWRNVSPGCTMAFRSSLKVFYLENATDSSPHDWEINLFAALFDGLYFLNKKTTDYRIHSSNTLGMSVGNSKLKMNADQSKRSFFSMAEADKASAYQNSKWFNTLSVERKKIITEYLMISTLRAKILSECKIGLWFHVSVVRFRGYNKLQGLRGMLGDLVYILKNKKKISIQ